MACVARHEGWFGVHTARLRVVKDEPLGVDRPEVCQQCQPAPCVASCPTGALYRDERTGAVLVRGEMCVACAICAGACPFGMVAFHPETGTALICDLCRDDPACVRRCATGALRYAETDDA